MHALLNKCEQVARCVAVVWATQVMGLWCTVCTYWCMHLLPFLAPVIYTLVDTVAPGLVRTWACLLGMALKMLS